MGFLFFIFSVKDDRKLQMFKNARLNHLVRARKIDVILSEKDEFVHLLTDEQAYSLLKTLVNNTSFKKMKQDHLDFVSFYCFRLALCS